MHQTLSYAKIKKLIRNRQSSKRKPLQPQPRQPRQPRQPLPKRAPPPREQGVPGPIKTMKINNTNMLSTEQMINSQQRARRRQLARQAPKIPKTQTYTSAAKKRRPKTQKQRYTLRDMRVRTGLNKYWRSKAFSGRENPHHTKTPTRLEQVLKGELPK